MVLRLAPQRSKDAEDSNNNDGAGWRRRGSGLPSFDEEDEDDACCCCCCCCAWLGRRCGGAPGRRSARVTPDHVPVTTSTSATWPQEAAGLRPAYGDLLTLDSIDSGSESQLAQHAPPQRPVVARPSNSPPTTRSASSTTSGAASAPGATRTSTSTSSAHHPLAPFEDTPPRNDSATSSRTSANATGSTVSLQNSSAPASGPASGGTSGYHSATASPGTDASNHRQVRDEEATLTNGFSRDGDKSSYAMASARSTEALDGASDGVDGESYPVVADVQSPSTPPSQDRFVGAVIVSGPSGQDAVGADVSPPPKRQSAATRRASRTPARPGRGVRVPLSRPRATTPGSLGSSAGSASLMSLANGSLSSSLGNSTASLFADTLPGFENPREALNRGLQQLDSNDWEVTLQALQTVVRLVRHHPAIIQGQLHACCESLSRQVRNLRSQVARAACQAASHLFHSLKRGMDAEAEDLSTALFNRTADTNKFLRADANTALDAMTDNITPSKAVSAIVHKGCRHQNAIVRAAGARLLARLVEKLGVERIMSQPRETRDLMLLTSARLLMEGSLETRSYTKSALKNLAQDHRLSSILVEIVPSNVMRSIDKTLKSCILRK